MADERRTFYMIGNSHIDPVWLWRDREGLQEARSTFASALARMDEFPEFVFSASSSALYAWVEKHHPALFARIQERVAQGRWQLVGGWWIEPDANIPGGESLVRQGLYGQRFFQRAFGKTARTSFNVDSFGHSVGLPRILAGQGIDRYVFMRPNPGQWQLPAPLFRWEDADGSAVIGSQIQGEYCAWTKTAILKNLEKTIAAMDETGLDAYPVYYGVGNHGGGPTIENIKAVRELAQERNADFIPSGLDAFFDTVDAQALPGYQGELEGMFPGCYTADSELKRLCRLCEEGLVKAEALAALMMPHGFAYPRDTLREAWALLMFAQFHDTMAGTARKEARDDACLDMARCLSVAREVTGGAMQALAGALDTRGDGHALLLYNPCDTPFDGITEADLYWRTKFPLRLKNPAGDEIPNDYSNCGLVAPDARKHIVFRAQVPAFGYALYRMLPETPLVDKTPMPATPTTLENEHLRLSFDAQTGALVSLYEKRHARELLSGPVTLEVYEDARDTWGAVGGIGKHLGQYALQDMMLLESGAARSTVAVRLAYGRSEATLLYSLGEGEDFFTIEGTLDNREKNTMTTLRKPFAPAFDHIRVEMPYAEIERPYALEGERHCQRYTQLVGDDAGVLLVNEAKFGYRVLENAYETLLSRTPIHAFSTGEVKQTDRLYHYSDMGLLPFTLRVYPDAADMTRADRIRRAQRLHRPLEVLAIDAHDGDLTLRADTLAGGSLPEGCVTHVIKGAEDEGVVFRVESTVHTEQAGTIAYGGKAYGVTLPPLSLSTFHITPDGGLKTVSLLEETSNT